MPWMSAVMRVDGLLSLGQMVPVHVADGDDLDVGAAEDLGQVPVNPVVAAADQANLDPLAGCRNASPAEHARGNQHRKGESGRSGREESSPRYTFRDAHHRSSSVTDRVRVTADESSRPTISQSALNPTPAKDSRTDRLGWRRNCTQQGNAKIAIDPPPVLPSVSTKITGLASL